MMDRSSSKWIMVLLVSMGVIILQLSGNVLVGSQNSGKELLASNQFSRATQTLSAIVQNQVISEFPFVRNESGQGRWYLFNAGSARIHFSEIRNGRYEEVKATDLSSGMLGSWSSRYGTFTDQWSQWGDGGVWVESNGGGNSFVIDRVQVRFASASFTAFNYTSLLNMTTYLPNFTTQGNIIQLTTKLTNINDQTLKNVYQQIILSDGLESLQGLIQSIGMVAPNETVNVAWSIRANKPLLDFVTIKAGTSDLLSIVNNVTFPILVRNNAPIRVGVLDSPVIDMPTYFTDASHWRNDPSNLNARLNGNPSLVADNITSLDIFRGGAYKYHCIILPGNAPTQYATTNLVDFWNAGGSIIAFGSSVNFLTFSGVLPTESKGSNGYGVYWNFGSTATNQVVANHNITQGYLNSTIAGSSGCPTYWWHKINETSAEPNFIILMTKYNDTNLITSAAFNPEGSKGRVVFFNEENIYNYILGNYLAIVYNAINWANMHSGVNGPYIFMSLASSAFTVPLNKNFTLTLAIDNVGTDVARNLHVNISLPPEIQLEQGQTSYDGELGATLSQTLHATLKGSMLGNYTIYATADFLNSSMDLHTKSNQISITISEPSHSNLTLLMHTNQTLPVEVGKNFTINLVILNVGNEPSYSINVTVPIPEGLEIASGDTRVNGSLLPGESTTTSFNLRANTTGLYLLKATGTFEDSIQTTYYVNSNELQIVVTVTLPPSPDFFTVFWILALPAVASAITLLIYFKVRKEK